MTDTEVKRLTEPELAEPSTTELTSALTETRGEGEAGELYKTPVVSEHFTTNSLTP